MAAVHAALGFAAIELPPGPTLADGLLLQALFDAGAVYAYAGPGRLFDAPLANAAAHRQEELIGARQAEARQATAGAGRAAATGAYVGLATRNTTDAENSHDSCVIAGLKSVLHRLREDQSDQEDLPPVADIVAYCVANGDRLSGGDHGKVADVLDVIGRAQQGERVYALGATDEECLRRVWLRSSDPRNDQAVMRQALFDALADAWEPGAMRHIVCVNGRVGRILGSLAVVDWDSQNSNVQRLETIRNDVLDRALRTVHVVADYVAKDEAADPALRAAARASLAATPDELERHQRDTTAEAEAQLTDKTRAAVGKMVDAYVANLRNTTPGILPDQIAASIRADAVAAVV